ncbi:hypothetical protein HMPREF9332_00077 [Alloprevotella rava F0323]|uniref:Membrane protein insertase YidC n=1 Tax=Alloprevotella rava F0323 TaxID=679199 RepID=G5G927_9BACT|nr:membrane protein insertase YidC [Alloprevotella rava]EHG24812.1 hypothetical protein HMPREF9332_00077 [Alloprevotella rava F0323]
MDKNTLTGLFLIALVLIGYSYFAKPQDAQPQSTEQTQATQTTPSTEIKNQQPIQPQTVDSSDVFYTALTDSQAALPVVLRNEKVAVTISPKGGSVSEVHLLKFKSYKDFHEQTKKDLTLFDAKTAQMEFQMETTKGLYNLHGYIFQTIAKTDSSLTLALGATTGDTLYIDYTLLPNTYMVNVAFRSKGRLFINKPLQIAWNDKVRQQEKGLYFENMYSTLTYKTKDGNTEKLNEYKSAEEKLEGAVSWIAFKNQYFSAVIIAGKEAFSNTALKSDTCGENSGFVKDYSAQLAIPFDPSGKNPTQIQFYFGPNQYRYLQSMEKYRISQQELGLQDLVYLGWPIIRWINRFFTIYVFDFFTGFGMNMGIVLLIITLLLRVLVYPTTRKSYMSSAKMRVLKPKVDELQKKYPNKEDAMKRQQEMMTLYSQYGVSPMGGCLPMLIQMPVWIAMFNFIPNAFELRQQSFLWADDLSTYDDLISWGSDIWLLGDHLSLFCILFCGTNLLYSWLMMRQQQESMSGEQAQQMKLMQWMMFLMPVFFFFMFNKYSSGLNYYYFISLLTSALTMWYLRRTTDDARLLAKLEENFKNNKNNPNKKVGGFAARLQALQEQQEELRKKQEALRNRTNK